MSAITVLWRLRRARMPAVGSCALDCDRPEHLADDSTTVKAMFEVCDEFESYGYLRVGTALRRLGLVVISKKRSRA